MTLNVISESLKTEMKYPCTCGECEEYERYYECRGCGYLTPWCNGQDDDYYAYCDDCAVNLMNQENN